MTKIDTAGSRRTPAQTEAPRKQHGGSNMSFKEKIAKAADYCKENKDYKIVLNRKERKVLLVRDSTNPVRVAKVG